ncbi:MAG TPA: hypothetical protein VNN10_00430 [Dehalococcoidia bacterium]|nr:hypothetical protein [Dehalococcoidia bacterium]
MSPQDDGTLFPRHYRLPDGSEPRVLDVLRIWLHRARPEPHQPENHVVSARPWQRVARRAETVAGLLAAAIDARPLILGTTGDRIPYSAAAASPLEASLALVRPREAVFVSTRSYSGNPQARLRFRHGGSGYYLSVTDPVWELEIAGRREGEYRPRELGLDERRLLVTVSLGEPFNGDCYKLIAAIFEAPAPL